MNKYVWRMTATFADGRVEVRHFLTEHRAKGAAKRFAEERTEEWWGHEEHEERTYPGAQSVIVERSESVVWS